MRQKLHHMYFSEFVIYIQNNILTNSNKICDVRFAVLTFGRLKTSLLGQDAKDMSSGTRQCGDWKTVTDLMTEDHTSMHVLKPFLGPCRWRK